MLYVPGNVLFIIYWLAQSHRKHWQKPLSLSCSFQYTVLYSPVLLFHKPPVDQHCLCGIATVHRCSTLHLRFAPINTLQASDKYTTIRSLGDGRSGVITSHTPGDVLLDRKTKQNNNCCSHSSWCSITGSWLHVTTAAVVPQYVEQTIPSKIKNKSVDLCTDLLTSTPTPGIQRRPCDIWRYCYK